MTNYFKTQCAEKIQCVSEGEWVHCICVFTYAHQGCLSHLYLLLKLGWKGLELHRSMLRQFGQQWNFAEHSFSLSAQLTRYQTTLKEVPFLTKWASVRYTWIKSLVLLLTFLDVTRQKIFLVLILSKILKGRVVCRINSKRQGNKSKGVIHCGPVCQSDISNWLYGW